VVVAGAQRTAEAVVVIIALSPVVSDCGEPVSSSLRTARVTRQSHYWCDFTLAARTGQREARELFAAAGVEQQSRTGSWFGTATA
jgi:hypothetical protein